VTINAAWRFHTGDDPAWASPNFDDSQWPLMRIDKPWSEQGYKGYSSFAWYRITVKLPATHEPLALAMSRIADADEIYVNGKLIGADGQMRPAPVWRNDGPSLLNIPLAPGLQGQTVNLAIRVWESPMEASIADTGAASLPLLGTAQDIKRICRLSLVGSILRALPFWITDFVAGLIGLFSLALFLMRREAREYAWGALFLFCSPAIGMALWLRRVYEMNVSAGALLTYYLIALGIIFWFFFVWSFVRARADRLFVIGIAMVLLIPVAISLSVLGYMSVSNFQAVYAFARLSTGIIIFIELVDLARKGNRDAQLFLLPFLLSSVVEFIQSAMAALYWAGLLREDHLVLYHGDGFIIGWDESSLLLSYFAIGTVLVLRFTRSAQEEQRLSTEMESAHQVQAQLVPLHLPTMPHFHFEAAYLAASEVGGDFYQVFPQSDGGVLVAIGDVSGKGLKAAMLGSQVVGALRSLAQENLPPSQILARLNRQLVASSDGGFVTCCVARVASDGTLTLANAGHLAPYRNGVELAINSGFPLGMVPGVEYAESSAALEPGDRLTFLSDGVVEARSAAGELFGFDRAAAISTEPAQSIAGAAQRFGQEDDITVLTLAFAPAEVLHA
jgi:sigma-B regulation protein RsbU (phosphoserine phosphatase)